MVTDTPFQVVNPAAEARPGMRRISCAQCGAMIEVPEGTNHHVLTWCECCTEDHDHGRAAMTCDGIANGHPGQECPHPDPLACTAASDPGEECPGGHCGIGIDGCTVCRPVIHHAIVGEILLQGTGA